MNLLKKIKEKWLKNSQENQSPLLSPQIQKWGYEVALESYLELMDPELWDLEPKDGLFQITFKEKRWYTDLSDSDQPGMFTTEDLAVEAINQIIEKAAKDFDDTVDAINELPDEED